jgi:hypothetical protein
MMLVEKKLMSMIKKGNTHLFTSETPEKISYLLDRQIIEINKEKQQLDEIMPDLKLITNPL